MLKKRSTAPQAYKLAISFALGLKPYYQGTVTAAEKAARRKRGKAARAARKAARR